jgi:mono/diheme cytochrome c family protein
VLTRHLLSCLVGSNHARWLFLGGLSLLAAAALTGAMGAWRANASASSLSDAPAVIARGGELYAARCASCHGAHLEGQPDWQSPRADGKMPAPPHNSDGHTWHHDGATLFGITKHGLVPPWAPANYRSDMPAFAGVLRDEEIRAVLSFIASTWNDEAKAWQRQIEAQSRQ